MKAKDLYRVLEAEVKPVLTAHDFKKQRASRLVFQRLVGGVFHSVWFQTGKYGWDSYAGGEFYVNFAVADSPDVESVRRRDERLNYFLTDAELISAHEYQNAIIARIPKPPESYFEALQTAFAKTTSAESAASLITTVRGYFEPEPLPFRRHQDFASRYWEPDDIKGWATLISSVIPRALDQMQTWTLPASR